MGNGNYWTADRVYLHAGHELAMPSGHISWYGLALDGWWVRTHEATEPVVESLDSEELARWLNRQQMEPVA